ncbi:MAG: hypothetical protein GTN89_01190, partial [Acidobacteria bacterium]|nr:hypothetical protein [Acidobacteriota bacterium]NIO58001.1 hypothetical protein [Acidobacteriota bacterium]NIQ29006.1 hypothetical protein [Acidobacteriota bacterium]NIQ83528.1 hypothetical protein [Acidobacteriota bacterium]
TPQEPALDGRIVESESELQNELEAIARREAEIARREAVLEERQAQQAAEAEAQARAEAEAAARRPIVLTIPALTGIEIDLNEDLSSETSLVGDRV